jgi:hypothetical protein
MSKPVIIESPYAGKVPLHLQYLRACLRDSVLRGESPYASHALLTQPGVLRDEHADERELGIAAGFAWRPLAKLTALYEDLGWSSGMNRTLGDCQDRNLPYECRSLGDGWLEAQVEREGNCDASAHWLQSILGTPR